MDGKATIRFPGRSASHIKAPEKQTPPGELTNLSPKDKGPPKASQVSSQTALIVTTPTRMAADRAIEILDRVQRQKPFSWRSDSCVPRSNCPHPKKYFEHLPNADENGSTRVHRYRSGRCAGNHSCATEKSHRTYGVTPELHQGLAASLLRQRFVHGRTSRSLLDALNERASLKTRLWFSSR